MHAEFNSWAGRHASHLDLRRYPDTGHYRFPDTEAAFIAYSAGGRRYESHYAERIDQLERELAGLREDAGS